MHQAVVETTQILIQAAADDSALWWLLAYHLRKLRQNDEAEHAYRRSLELVPASAGALHNLSLIVEEKGVFRKRWHYHKRQQPFLLMMKVRTKNAQCLNAIHEQAQQKQEEASSGCVS